MYSQIITFWCNRILEKFDGRAKKVNLENYGGFFISTCKRSNSHVR